MNLQEDAERQQIDYPALYEEYLREIDFFDKKYPDSQIEEDFSDDVLALHPDYTDREAAVKTNLLRLGISGRRTYRFWEKTVKDFLLENDIPLRFADNEYEMGEQEVYQPGDKPLVIKDFKKVIAYSPAEKDRLAVQDKLARDAGRMTHYERSRILKQALLERDWKTLISYGLFDGTALEDERGVGLWFQAPELRARLLASVKTVVPAGAEKRDSRAAELQDSGTPPQSEIKGALQLYTEPGWFLLNREFQQNPGLEVSFGASENLAGIELNWPLPRRYFSGPHQSFTGYPGLISVPFVARVTDSSRPLKLAADVSAGLCNEAGCRKVSLQPQLVLDVGSREEASAAAVMLRQIESQSPRQNGADITLHRLVVEDGKPGALRLEAETDVTPSGFEAFIEGTGSEEFAPPLIWIEGRRIVARFVPLKPDAVLEGREFSIVAGFPSGQSVRKIIKAEKAAITDPENGNLNIAFLLAAFAGGLLLNLMPCVLPVLILKIMALARFGALDVKQIRQDFTAVAAGIVFTAALLAGILIVLKFSGHAVGWGIQFQSTAFLVLMIFIISTLMAYLWGWLRLPGSGFWEKRSCGRAGEFFIRFLGGVLITLLAVSCAMPYPATVFGGVISGSPFDMLAVWACIGAGLAAPYILFAALPAAAYYIPRPGRWLRWANLAVLVLLSVSLFWLLTLLSLRGGAALWWHFIFFIGGFWLIVLFRKKALDTLEEQEDDPEICYRVRIMFNTAAAVLICGLVFWAYQDAAARTAACRHETTETVEYEQIRELVNQGRPVLVKIGADWCLSCKYNDFAAFGTPQVQQALEQKNVVVLDIDWTDYNENVLHFMQRFGRRGIPFYMIFAPRIPGGMVLPQILSERDLLAIIENLSR